MRGLAAGACHFFARDLSCVARPRMSDSRHAGPDRAAHARAAEPAVAARILGEILLVIVLGEVERACINDLGRDRPVAVCRERLFVHRLRVLGRFALRRRGHIDAGAILRADVVALAHALRRVVALPERLEQRLVGDLGRIVDHQHHLVVAGAARAELLVGRIRRVPAQITHRGGVDPIAQLPERALRAPKAPEPEDRGLEAGRVRAFEGTFQDEVARGGRDRIGTTGQRLGGRRHFSLLAEHEHAVSSVSWP